MSLAEEVTTGDGVVADDLPRRAAVRSGADVLRLVVATALLAGLLAAEWWATTRLVTAQGDLASWLDGLPEPVQGGVVGATQLLAVGVPLAVLVVVVLQRDLRFLLTAGLAGVLAAVAEELLAHAVLRTAEPTGQLVGALADGWLGTPFPGAPALAAGAAVATVALPRLERRWRRVMWGVLVGVAVAVVVTALAYALTTTSCLVLGVVVGSAVLVAFGSPERSPRAAHVAARLLATGVDVVACRELPGGSPPARHYRVERAAGVPLFVKVLDDDARSRDLLLAAWGRVSLRLRGDRRPSWSLQERAEHEAFATTWARRAGVRVPEVVAVRRVDHRSVLVATELVPGTPLGAAGPEEAAAALPEAWRQLDRLHDAGIAHGPLDPDDVVLDGPRAWIVDLDRATLEAEPERLARDSAALLVAGALAVGAEASVAAGVAGGGAGRVVPALPYLQRLALPSGTRARLRHHRKLLGELRLAVVTATGADEVPLEQVSRLNRKVLVRFALVFALLYLVLPQLGSIGDSLSALGDARWGWVVLALLYLPSNYAAAGLRMVATIPERLAFGPVFLLQMANAFLNRVTPNNVGGMTLTVRFLQKAGVPTEAAAASVGIQSVTGMLGLAAWLAVFFWWAGRRGETGFVSLPSEGIVFGVLAVAIAVLAVLWFVPLARRRLLEPALRFVRGAAASILAVAKQPGKLALLVIGALLDPIVDVICFVWILKAFSVELSFAAAGALYLGGSTIGDAVPLPGGLGATEAALIAGLAGAGVDIGVATSAVLVYRLVSYWGVLAPGWVCLKVLRRRESV